MQNKMNTVVTKLFVLLAFLIPIYSNSQNKPESNWKISDRVGNEYDLPNVSTTSTKNMSGTNSYSTNASNHFCTAGYFDLSYEIGSYFDGNTAAQAVMCEVFRNLSGLINSPLLSNTVTVRILLGNISGTINPAAIAFASPLYLCPVAAVPQNLNPSVIESLVYKTIKSGSDAYNNIPPSTFVGFPGNSQYYHGYITIKPSVQWYAGLGTSTVSAEYDLYSVMLHEAMHVLGFLSLMDANGQSNLGSGVNYYSSYDKFLYNSAMVPLLPSSTPSSCPNSNLAFTLSASNLHPGSCPNTNTNTTTCASAVHYSSTNTGTVPVYTPDCFEVGSSLSHFEDLCYAPNFTAASTCTPATNGTNNDLYWLMSNGNGSGSCYVKRYPKPLERLVLCDLGYNVNSTYTSNATAAPFNYSTSACAGKNIWGVDDGFNGSIYTFTTTATSVSINTIVIASNDATTTTQLSCLEVLYNNATAIISSGSLVVTANTGYHGLVVIKYLPENSSGQQGNPTYVYVYFVPSGCSPSGMCNLIQNGNFESVVYGPGCNPMIAGPTNLPLVSTSSLPGCWETYLGSPAIFERNCTNTLAPAYNLSFNTLGTTIDSYNGTPNNHIIGLAMNNIGSINTSNGLTNPPVADVLKNNLSSPMTQSNTYKVSFLASNFSGTIANPNNQPIVITVASAPVFNMASINNFPSGLNFLAQFTISATSSTASPWTAYTQTFVFNQSIPHSALLIGCNVSLTFPSTSTLNNSYCFLDEVSIQSLSTPTFNIPNAQNCGNTSFSNLAQYATGTGTFTGANVVFSSPNYNFNLSTTLPSGNYPIAYSSSNGTCINTVWQNVSVAPNFTLLPILTATGCSGSTMQVSNSSSLTSMYYQWVPGNLVGSTQTLNLTSSAVYTVSGTYTNICTKTETLAVPVPTNCCFSPGIASYTETSMSLSSLVLTGPKKFPNSFTIQPNSQLILMSDFLISPGVKITVSSTATLELWGAHLYGCLDMWQGIEVLDGGMVRSVSAGGHENMIEDAEIAIDASNYNPNSIYNFINLKDITFNKNYIGINLSNYTLTSNTYSTPLLLSNCVFTCRNFAFSSSAWPNASMSDLRAATNSTTGLASPYDLQNAPLATLKSPHTLVPSHIAINILNSGSTATLSTAPNVFSFNTIYIGPAPGGIATNNFILFDAHENFITSSISNIRVENCVFQNTQTLTLNNTITANAAIQFTSGLSNVILEISGANSSTGCRFWNCHTALNLVNATSFNLENAIFRSIQSNSSITSSTFISVGEKAVNISSIILYDYNINYNEFTNISDAILISCTHQFSTYAGPTYLNVLSIHNNTFSPYLNTAHTATSTNYMKNGISIVDPLANIITPHFTTNIKGLSIQNNLFYRVYNGITVNGINPHYSHYITRKLIRSNTITLEEDIWNNIQKGIDNSNTIAWYWDDPGIQSIEQNSITLFGGNISNTNVTLLYSFSNYGGGPTNYVICNTLTAAYQGFEFEGPNYHTYWRGNEMSNLKRGMTLMNSGVIGPQGFSSSSPTDNKWTNSWSGNTALYVDGGSNAQFSPLRIKAGTPWTPPSYGGTGSSASWYSAFGATLSATGTYTCGGAYMQIANGLPDEDDYDTDEMYYMAQTIYYRALSKQDSIRDNNSNFLNFFESLAGSTIDKFLQVEEKINENDLSSASSILTGMNQSGFNSVETNYYNFYTLYLKYSNISPESPFTNDDFIGLSTLAGLCPGTNGAPVYQARALYQMIAGKSFNTTNNCSSGARPAFSDNEIKGVEKNWDVILFPNPAQNLLNIITKNEVEELQINIRDLSGRVVLEKKLTTLGNKSDLLINLVNGAYIITISNANNENVNKALLISK
jgi:hypothetical protein